MKRALIFGVALLAVLSCSRDSSPTAPLDATGILQATVLEAHSNTGIANVTIEVRREETGPLVTTGTTNTLGVSEIKLPTGTYWARVVAPAGYSLAGGRADMAAQLPVGPGRTAAVTVTLSKL